jgi:oligopeptide transport system ATP-binding protein
MSNVTKRVDPLSRLPGYDAAAPALEIVDLHVEFRTREGIARVLDGIDCAVDSGETLAVLGESGCGKSVTARTVMGILPDAARVTSGSVRLHGVDVLGLDATMRRRIRGRRVAMVFQDALSALNPVLPVGYQIAEMFRVHQRLPRRAARQRAVEMLDLVRIPAAERRASDYPHQFSGGMRQRAMIAMALALDPDVLIADEPTTALDVTVQAQIMELIAELQAQRNMGLILISHDMGVVADVADRVVVMYAGRVVERASAAELYRRPAHPYTRALLDAIPRRATRGQPLAALPGAPPDLARLPEGCALRPRCPMAIEQCKVLPPRYEVGPGRISACHRWQEVLGP